MFIEKFPEWFELEYRITGRDNPALFFGGVHWNVIGNVSVRNPAEVPFICIKYEGMYCAPIYVNDDGYYLAGTYRLSDYELAQIRNNNNIVLKIGDYRAELN